MRSLVQPLVLRGLGNDKERSSRLHLGCTSAAPRLHLGCICSREASNGFPNDYWGWGMEEGRPHVCSACCVPALSRLPSLPSAPQDDQLRLRIRASGGAAGGVVRPTESGRYRDLDSVAVLRDVLCSVKSAARGLHLINERFLAPSRVLGLDDEWRDANGPRDRGTNGPRRSES